MIAVRCAERDELSALAPLHATAFERGWSADAMAEMLDIPGTEALSAGPLDGPYGFLMLRTLEQDSEILTLVVSPAMQRQGVGAALVAAATARAIERKAERLWLEVAEGNVAAIALYRSKGFETIGRRRGYYRTSKGSEDALMLRRVLNSPAGSAYAAAP